MKCRWKTCDQQATHHDPPLCDKHHKARAERLRGPSFILPKENTND